VEEQSILPTTLIVSENTLPIIKAKSIKQLHEEAHILAHEVKVNPSNKNDTFQHPKYN